MAFPTSPTDGQISDGYKYNATIDAWEELSGNMYNLDVGDIYFSLNPDKGRLTGDLPFGSPPVSQSDFSELYAVIGDSLETAWTDLGYSASGSGMFYPTPPTATFPRTAIPKQEFSTSEVDTSNDRIDDPNGYYFPFHINRNGTPVIISTDDTAPGGITTGTIYYTRIVNSNGSIELYDTEANAIDDSGTTGRVSLTSIGTGPHYISNAGVRIGDAMQGHFHSFNSDNNQVVGPAGGGSVGVSGSGYAGNRVIDGTISDGTNGTPRNTNETRPEGVYMYGYVKASHIGPTGEAISALRYSTDWVSNSDWTNKEISVTHNLNENLSDLIVKFFISTDGTEANAFEVPSASEATTAHLGYTIFASDTNNIKIQTGVNGILQIDDAQGYGQIIDTESYYYKVVVYKPNILTTYTGNQNTIVTISDSTNQTVVIDTTANYPMMIQRTGSGSGKLIVSAPSGSKIKHQGLEIDSLEFEVGDSGVELFPLGGDLYVKSVIGCELLNINSTIEVVYTKIFTGTLDNDSETTITHGVDFDKIISANMMSYDDNSQAYLIATPYYSAFSNNANTYQIQSTNIRFNGSGSYHQGNNYRVAIKYYI